MFDKGLSANNKPAAGKKSSGVEQLSQVMAKVQGGMQVGRVTDIILNGAYPNIEDYGGLNGIGTIFFELNNFISDGRGIAKPFYPQTSAYPLVNELVLLFKLPNNNIGRNTSEESYYYINMISLWNHPHHNAYPNPVTSTTLPDSQQKDYQQTEAGSVRRVTDESTEIGLNSPINLSQATFIERTNIHPLLPFAGDVMYQGRWGNSIRFGSTAKPFNIPDIINPLGLATGQDALNDWSETGTNGDPITIIRNGQNPESSDEGWVPITENINDDLSSIYQTSTQKIPIQVASENYNSYVTPPEIPSQYTKPQVIINSDRLVFNAKTDSILLSAEKSIGLSSNSSLNFNTNNYIVDAGNILLGSKNAKEPLVKGETLYKNLTQIVNALTTLVDVMEVQQLWPGGVPTPDGATSVTARATKDILNNVQKDLVNIKSKVSKTI
jgi:hypothetical protein